MSTITVKTNGQTLKVNIARADGVRPTDVLTVTNKALADNVATLTTSRAHNLATNNTVVVAGVDATFNGTYTVTSAPTTTTFTYAKTAGDVTSAAVTGGTATVQSMLNSSGARVMLPATISSYTVFDIPADFGSWVVTTTLTDDTAVDERTVTISPTQPAVISPALSQAALSAYVATTVANA